MRKLIFFLLSLYAAKLSGQPQLNPTGNLFDPVEYANVLASPLKKKGLREIAKNIPTSYSLREYCPTPGNQSPYGTCTAWALAAARTTLLAINKNITDQEKIDSLWFSPGFIYQGIKNAADDDCEHGSWIEKGLELLKCQGVCFDRTLVEDCDVSISKAATEEALQYTIEGYRTIFYKENKRQKIREIKYLVHENLPVLISFTVPTSFHHPNNKFWVPLPTENPNSGGCHAMIIVGYDDDFSIPGRSKGAFLFMNSWGKNWKDRGFVWVSYTDFDKWCDGAYYAIPREQELMPEFDGKLHLFVVADTDDPKNGENADRSASTFLKAFHQIGYSALLQPIDYLLNGTKYNRREVLDAINRADIGVDDAVVLFYCGKGLNLKGNDFPNLQFDGNGGLLLTGLEKKIAEKRPRLSLLIADANNTEEADYRKPRRKLASYLLPGIDDMELRSKLIHEEYFSGMFRKFQGQILVAAGKKGQKAIYDSRGSFFLRGLLHSFSQLNQSVPDWSAQLSLTAANTQHLAQSYGYAQQPIYRISISSISSDSSQACDVTSLTSDLLEAFNQTWSFDEKKKLAYGMEALCTSDAEVVILIDGIMVERMPAVQYLKELAVNPKLDSLQLENMAFEGCLLKELVVTEFYSEKTPELGMFKTAVDRRACGQGF